MSKRIELTAYRNTPSQLIVFVEDIFGTTPDLTEVVRYKLQDLSLKYSRLKELASTDLSTQEYLDNQTKLRDIQNTFDLLRKAAREGMIHLRRLDDILTQREKENIAHATMPVFVLKYRALNSNRSKKQQAEDLRMIEENLYYAQLSDVGQQRYRQRLAGWEL